MPRAVVIRTSATPASTRSRTKRDVASFSDGNPPPDSSVTSRRRGSSTRVASAAGASVAETSTRNRRRKSRTADAPALRPAKRRKVSGPGSSGEQRLARYIPQPNASTSERITRAFQHRMYLIDKKLVGDPSSPSACDFLVLGSTGNVYDVKLQQQHSCTCPDFPRSRLCKHILFVMLRVLKLSRTDPRVWQKALLTSELKELLEIPAVNDGVLASESVRRRFQEMQGSSQDIGDFQSKTIQREVAGDCPICYEKMDDKDGKAKEPVVFCRVCGNNVHRDCFQKWSQSKSLSGGHATCIYCRALWSDESEKKKGKNSSNYVNLAEFSDAHRTQDLSLETLYPDSHEWIRYHGRRGR